MNFNILKIEQIGDYVIAKIHYPDCTNFYGNKICVFKDATIDQIQCLSTLDPHFSGNGFSPIARFKPTEEGYAMAVCFCKAVSSI